MDPYLSYSQSQSAVSEAVVDQLRRTRGWVFFLAILAWIGAVFLCLGGLIMVGMGVVAGAAGTLEETADPAIATGGLAAMGGLAVLGAVYFVMAFFYIYPALKLTKYAARIRDLMATPSEQNLVVALNEQRAFWKFAGIMTLVGMAAYGVFIAIMLIVGVVGAAAGAAATPTAAL